MTRKTRLVRLSSSTDSKHHETLAAAYVMVLAPVLIVPPPVTYLFVIAWFVLLGLAIAWWRHHPWRSFFVPLLSTPLAALTVQLGEELLGWVP